MAAEKTTLSLFGLRPRVTQPGRAPIAHSPRDRKISGMQAMPAAAIESAEEEALRERFREAMKRRQVTQTQLAEQLGITQPSVNLLLNGESRLGYSRAVQIAKALGMQIKIVG